MADRQAFEEEPFEGEFPFEEDFEGFGPDEDLEALFESEDDFGALGEEEYEDDYEDLEALFESEANLEPLGLEAEEGELSGAKARRAIRLNRRYARSLGWQARRDDIARLLGFTDMSPDEATFAQAVARWQGSRRLTADGIIGPRTWRRMRAQLAVRLSDAKVRRAIRLNRRYARSLGWQARRDDIARLLGFTDMSPDEATFAQAVARWQNGQGLTADGIIGPNTWRKLRRVLDVRSTPAALPIPTGIPRLGGPRVPPGYRPVVRRGKVRGLARYASERLDQKLLALHSRGIIDVSRHDIDTFQRIANVETSGKIQGINTWDSAAVSAGFMQWTLQHGKLQEWIGRAPVAFRRFGIALDEQRTYSWGKKNPQQAIGGAATKNELRWNGWAERFFLAGLDDEIIAAEVSLAAEWLRRHLRRLRYHLRKRKMAQAFETFQEHYEQSLYLRGIFQAAYNNLPVAAINGTINALRAASRDRDVSTERFLRLYKSAILGAYRARNDDGSRVVSETKTGVQQNR